VTAYAQRVSQGQAVAGPHVRAACLRHLRDLEDGPKRGLEWDEHEAGEAFRFFREILRLNGGEFEGREFELHESQEFIVGSLFGWKRADGTRRFRMAYIEEGKGSGKSPMAAGIGLKMLSADNEPRAEVYAFATKRDQAQILFRDAVAMVEQSPELSQALKCAGGKGSEWNIYDDHTASFFRPISSDDSQSGPRPHCSLGDEVHEHKSALMVEMMRAGLKGRRQPLIVLITNSGTDRQSVCWEYHEYARKVCDGSLTDDAFFGYVCALDVDDDPFSDESCWPKANPLLGITIQPQYLREQVLQARGMPSKEATVRRLNFCQWTDAANPWLSYESWKRAEDAEFDDARLLGRRCFGGLDLASTTDLTAFALLFEPTGDDPIWRQKVWFWLPAEALAEKERADRAHYGTWRAAGWLETTPGSAIDKLFVLARLVDAAQKYEVQSIGYDRYRIEDLLQFASTEGIELPLHSFGQGWKDMAPAVDEYERMLKAGELKHDGNPLMTWNAASVVLDTDPAGNRKPTKQRSTGRIDGIVAAVMAAGRSLKREEEQRFRVMVV